MGISCYTPEASIWPLLESVHRHTLCYCKVCSRNLAGVPGRWQCFVRAEGVPTVGPLEEKRDGACGQGCQALQVLPRFLQIFAGPSDRSRSAFYRLQSFSFIAVSKSTEFSTAEGWQCLSSMCDRCPVRLPALAKTACILGGLSSSGRVISDAWTILAHGQSWSLSSREVIL